jgi:hypothetical protein
VAEILEVRIRQTGGNCVYTELHIEEKKFLYARTVWLK